jgi:hypothetical protein
MHWSGLRKVGILKLVLITNFRAVLRRLEFGFQWRWISYESNDIPDADCFTFESVDLFACLFREEWQVSYSTTAELCGF